MYRTKKRRSRLLLTILVVFLAISGVATPMTASAAAPAAIPSQIALSLAGGADAGKSAMGFNWVTDPTVNNSEIIYGTSPNLTDGAVKSATMTTPVAANSIPDNKLTNFKPINSFNVIIQDLTPETKYYYRVGNASNGYSAIASFISPADPAGKKPFSFVISPDTQGTSVSTFANTGTLYDYIKENESDAAFLIHNGDVVEDASYSDHWQYFFDAAQNLLNTLPVMATPGNHDGASYDKNFVQYNARFNYSSLRQPEGLSPAADGTVYAFEYGDALFISINSNASSADNNVQWKFLEEEAAATTKTWKIVNIHASPYDPGASHYQVDNVTGKKLTDAGIDLVLSGHEHAYARSTLKTTSSSAGTGSIQKAKFGEAPTYVIGGSVYNYAYSLDNRDTSWNDYFYDLRINKTGTGGGAIYSPGVYSKVEVTSNAIIYKAYYKATGSENPFRVIDTFTISKTGDKITQPTGGGKEPTSVTFLFDSFMQESGKYIARFNWVTPVTTKTTELYYAKKTDFESNGGKFTNVAVGSNNTVDLSSAILNANYNGAGTSYSVEPIQSHKAETAVLEPDTEYVYSVGDGAKDVTSVVSPAGFKTPASNLDTFNFVWVTDMHAALNSSHNDKALTQAFNDFPDASFILSSGDQVSYGFDTWQWDSFFEANADKFARVPLYMGTGNHEYDGAGNSWAPNSSWNSVDPTLQNLFGRYNPPKNGASFYGGGDGTQRMVAGIDKLQFESSNYYWVYGDTLFMMMDYQDQSSSAQIKAQQDWMKSVIKQNPTKWRVAVLHKSLFGYRMANPVASWTNAFDEAGVDVVLMGHDHVYVRTKLYGNGQIIEPQAYGNGTTYITSYSGNNDRRGTYYTKDPANVAYVDVRAIGPGYANVSISPNEIRVTSKGFDSSGTLVNGDSNALVTNTPRIPNLSAWSYPSVPQDVNELSITEVAVTGIAKEGQTLNASVTPSSATAAFRWERSTDGTTWTTIAGETSSNYTVKTEDVGQYLRTVATGTGFYNGVATSSATAKVTPLAGSGTAVIKIGTASELVALSEGFGSSAYPIDGKYELSADIDMKDVAFSAIGGGATPTPFLGTFNGKGYTISNLTIASSNNSTGFFAYIGTGGRVVNAKLTNVDITGVNSTGSIAGTSTGTIENSYVDGKVTGAGYTGGIVGLLHAGTVQNSSVTASVYGNTAGGLIGGSNWNNSGSPLTQKDTTTGKVILNNYVAGTVKGLVGGQYFGAVVGDMGGSSGSLLQTFNGNTVTNAVYEASPGKIGGYWSGSRPIIDSNQVNYYDSNKLSTSGLPTGVAAAFVGKTAVDFVEKATFEALGWDFTNVWDWDAVNNVPVPRVINIGGEEDNFVTIIASASAGGTISPNGYVLVERGQSQKFTFTPNQYFEIATVKIDGVEDAAAAAAGEYTFDNVAAVHSIDVAFKISDATSGVAPSLVSTSAYYNRAIEAHIWVTVDFGSGALGIQPDKWRQAVKSVKIMKGNELVLDAAGCYWFPSTGYGAPEDRLEIAYDDIQKLPEYDHLVPGTYDLVITFADLNSTEYTIPLTVEDKLPSKSLDLSDLRVDGTTVSGFSTDTTSYTLNVSNNQSSVTVAATAVDEKATVTIAGGNNLAIGDNTITVTVTAEDGLTSKVYTITVKRAAASGDGGNSNNNGNSSGNSNGSEGGGTVAPTVDNKQTLPANIGGTARFMNNAVTITVPAGATEKPLTITVEKVLNPSQLVTSKDVLLSPVYEILKNLADNFKKPITLTLTFDPNMIGANQIASLFYYDEVKKTWVEIGGKVSSDRITAEIDQFAKVAVFAVNNKSVENPESKPVDNVKLKLSDIAGHWAEASIQELAAKGIVSGYADGTFKPKGEVTRAEFAVMLARMLNMQGNGATLEFTDNASIGAWAKEGIAQAVQAGIVNGYGDGSFRPNARISRTEMVTMIANALGIVDNAKARTAFADDAEIPAWAKSAVAATVESGIVQGVSGNKFAPKQTATRAEAAVILLKALAFVGK
ncbi:putative phosphodiesterase [Fontibacillus solani]|uniref:Putative phosphodiesterase n=1 Tax=Fontibacillus solani TaxID=1572857 RepID=A0A7W3XT29_9BACL|nr:S-layer homology domain-containing protein [Fontibacillus solani]MBA9087186.1 putative phosphodiesterase [Fontibacillus solani]